MLLTACHQINEVVIEETYEVFLSETELLLAQAESLMLEDVSDDEMHELDAIVNVIRLMLEIAAIVYSTELSQTHIARTFALSESILVNIHQSNNSVSFEHVQKLKEIISFLQAELRSNYRATTH
jgi:hypothetical protein